MTGVKPFELVLSRPPETLSIQARPTLGQIRSNLSRFKKKYRQWIKALVSTAAASLRKRQDRYKIDFDARLRLPLPTFKVGDLVHLELETTLKLAENSKKDRVSNKLVPVTEGPYTIMKVDSHTVTIKRHDGTWEKVSKDRLSSTGTPRAITPDSSRVRQDDAQRRRLTAEPSENSVPAPGRVERIQGRGLSDSLLPDATRAAVVTRHSPLFAGTVRNDRESSSGGTFVVDKVLSVGDDGNGSEPKHLIKWAGYAVSEATWEPVSALDYNYVLRFCKRHDAATPDQKWWSIWTLDA